MGKDGFSQDPTDITRRGKFDQLVKIPIFIDHAESEINQKETFSSIITDLTLADTETLALAFKTPAGTKRVHLIGEFITLTGGRLDFIEGPTWDNESGSLNPIFNRFREASPQASAMLEDGGQAPFTATDNVIKNPTTLAGGTIISNFVAFGEKNRFSGDGYAIAKWILEPDTQYACLFTSTAAANSAQVRILWFEHTDE